MFKLLDPIRRVLSGPIIPATPDAIQKVSYPGTDSDYQPAAIPTAPSSLKLSPERLKWFIQEYIIPRIAEVMLEMGLLSDGNIEADSWMAVRQRNQDSYDGNLEWRKAIGGIFATGNNFSLGTNKRYARLLSARVRSNLMGTRPFFGAMTKLNGNPKLTEQVESFVQERIDESNVPDALRDGLRVALIRNEAVMKTTYLLSETTFTGPLRVLVNAVGQPLQTPLKKLWIEEMDEFSPSPDAQGVMFLEKDPSFQMQPGQFQYKMVSNLPQVLTAYDNPHSDVLDWRDFLCPLKVRSTHEADINVHFFHENPDNLRGTFQGLKPAIEYFGRRARGATVTGQEQPKLQQGEKQSVQSKVLGRMLIGDVYCRVDYGLLMNNQPSGQQVETWLMLDVDNSDAIFYDFLGNHMSMRPFTAIPGLERVPGRWYGVGVFTKMEHGGLYIDTQFNRVNEKDSQNSSFNFRIPHAVAQWKSGQPVNPGSRDFLDCLPGYDAKNPPAFRVNLAADSALDLNLMDRMMQAGDLEFAVISSRDASASDLNQSKTATGVMSIDRDANVVAEDTEYEHIKGLEQVLGLSVEHLLNNMDAMEMRFDPKLNLITALNRDEIRALPRKVRLMITKTRSSEQQQMNANAEAVWLRYMRLNPYEQFIGRPFYVKQLKGLQVDDVDELLPKVTQQQAEQFLAQQAAAAQQGKSEVAKSIAAKLTDLAPSERAQVLQSEGIKPAPEAELAAKDTKDQAEKLALKATAPPKPPDEQHAKSSK